MPTILFLQPFKLCVGQCFSSALCKTSLCGAQGHFGEICGNSLGIGVKHENNASTYFNIGSPGGPYLNCALQYLFITTEKTKAIVEHLFLAMFLIIAQPS